MRPPRAWPRPLPARLRWPSPPSASCFSAWPPRRSWTSRRLPSPRSCAERVRHEPATLRLPQRGWLFDLDGTVYRGDALIPGAAETLAALRADGRRVVFLSNKPLETRADYASKLTRLGVPAVPDDVINSSLVLARHLAVLDPGAPVFVIGEPPLIGELRAHGFDVRADHRVRWVVIAF